MVVGVERQAINTIAEVCAQPNGTLANVRRQEQGDVESEEFGHLVLGRWELGIVPSAMTCRARLLSVFVVALVTSTAALAQAPVEYRLSFPEPEHRWVQVDLTFPDVPPGPLELHMSRSSPGRYAIHQFAKNVFDVRITDASGAALDVTRPNPDQWTVARHPAAVRVSYRVFGDRVDGTYLGIDTTHAHLNMPAVLMWAPGFEERPVTVRFDAPPGSGWRVGTQLMPGPDPFTFTAPNLQYLIDSPTEFSAFSVRSFTIPGIPSSPTFRLVVHHTGTDAELDAFAANVMRIVREARSVFGEYPAFEGNTYTFIADYLPWATGDGMEHRNSTILTSAGSIRATPLDLLDTISHEFFHSWNAERIRPRSLEPFNLADVNMSGELWMAEGFTSYYGPLVLLRTGLLDLGDFVSEMAGTINDVALSPGRVLRTAEEMSRFAPFVDAAAAIDRTSFDNTFVSYYTWGEAIALGLDLTLRDRTDSRVTLDDYMRALWQKFGKPGGKAPGYVDNPYTIGGLKEVLGTVSGDTAFAGDFFARFIQGHDVVDYRPLLARAGFILRPASPGRGFVGQLRLQDVQERVRITAAVPFGSSAYRAGLERDDVIVALGGRDIRSASEFERMIRERKPGETIPIAFERRGQRVMSAIHVIEDPRVEIVGAERTSRPLTMEEKTFRGAWLSTHLRESFGGARLR
jgi:predicted metalloprotease with PDZ domain